MINQLESVLVNNGWFIANPSEPHIWTKENAIFDTINDIVTALTGTTINFKNHGDGIQARFKCAERLALTGSF